MKQTKAVLVTAVSAAILAKVAAGLNIRQAIDAVLGVGTTARVIGEVYDELRARAARGEVSR